MYLFEWGLWHERSKDPEVRAREDAELDAHYGEGYFDPSGPVDEDAKEWGPTERASEHPTDGDAFYKVNDTFIEARAAWQEEKRGLITFLTLGLAYSFGYIGFWQIGLWPVIYMTTYGM